MKFKTFFSVFLAMLITGTLFGLTVLLALSSQKLIGAEVSEKSVPYEPAAALPDDTAILVSFPDGYAAAFSLDFSKSRIRAVLLEKGSSLIQAQAFGFFCRDTVIFDYASFIRTIDLCDGILIETGDQTERLTGAACADLLAENPNDRLLRKNLLAGFFAQIQNRGFSSDALSCIIKETKTTLSVPKCFGYEQALPPICSSFQLINEEASP